MALSAVLADSENLRACLQRIACHALGCMHGIFTCILLHSACSTSAHVAHVHRLPSYGALAWGGLHAWHATCCPCDVGQPAMHTYDCRGMSLRAKEIDLAMVTTVVAMQCLDAAGMDVPIFMAAPAPPASLDAAGAGGDGLRVAPTAAPPLVRTSACISRALMTQGPGCLLHLSFAQSVLQTCLQHSHRSMLHPGKAHGRS